MTVNAQYAKENLEELYTAVEQGDDVQIDRGDKPAVKLMLVPKVAVDDGPVQVRPRSEIFGSAIGEVWYAENWDSPEENAEIAEDFEKSEIFPVER